MAGECEAACSASSAVSVTWPSMVGLQYMKYGPSAKVGGKRVFYVPDNLTVSGNTAEGSQRQSGYAVPTPLGRDPPHAGRGESLASGGLTPWQPQCRTQGRGGVA